MPRFQPGDIVATKSNLYWHGEDVGDRLGRVIEHKGHVIVELFDYDDNPIKCFTYELEQALLQNHEDKSFEFDIDEMLQEFDP